MGFIPVEILTSTALRAGMDNLRANLWILDDILSWYRNDEISKQEYGEKEINAFKEFFLTNKIPVIQELTVTDIPMMPCISVYRNPRSEKLNRTQLGDYGPDHVSIEAPNSTIAQPVKVLPTFTPESYDPSTGTVTLPLSLNTYQMVAGQSLFSIKSGKSYPVLSVIDAQNFTIAVNTADDFTGGYVLPMFRDWNLHKEYTYFSESINIGCNVQGNPVHCLWLSDIVAYILLRCKEVYLEHRGFELSTFEVGAVTLNTAFDHASKIFSASINISGDTKVSFIKYRAPRIEGVNGQIQIDSPTPTPPQYLAEVQSQGWSLQGDTLGPGFPTPKPAKLKKR